MAKKETFFNVSDWMTHKPGDTLHVQKHVSFSYDGAEKSMRPLVSQDKKNLEKQRKESEAEEAKVYEKIKTHFQEWEGHASQTLLLTRAIEYLETKTVKHTKNQWKEAKDGTWEVSNLVYKMWFKTSKDAKTGGILLRWGLVYNVPEQPSSYHYEYNRYGNPWGAAIFIVRPENRSYASLESAQKFIQTRFDEYLPFFSELSPPVPRECQRMFSVNGYLLPGYTVAPTEKTIEQSADTLLDFLEDADTASKEIIPEPAEEKTSLPTSLVKTALPDKPTVPPKRKPTRQSMKKTERKKKRSTMER